MWLLRRRIRQIFFITMLSSLVMLFSAFSVPERMTQTGPLSFLGSIKSKSLEVKETVQHIDSEDILKARSVAELQEIVAQAEEAEKEGGNLNTYKIDDKKFVLIKGKYYEYRADNTYLIDGEATYFVDNSRNRYNGVEAAKKELAQRKEKKTGDILVAKNSGKSYQPQFGVKSLSPQNMKAMMDQLKDYKQKMQKRNQVLESLAEE